LVKLLGFVIAGFAAARGMPSDARPVRKIEGHRSLIVDYGIISW
jgi:hypothetical protein